LSSAGPGRPAVPSGDLLALPPSFLQSVQAIAETLERDLRPLAARLAQARAEPGAQLATATAEATVVEAQCRKYLIDPILAALGWRLDDPASVLVEEGVDGLAPGEHRRFLDYHGRASAAAGRRPLLLVEAKRLSAALPSQEQPGTFEPARTTSAILADIVADPRRAANRSNPLEQPIVHESDWATWVLTLRDYLLRIERSAGQLPQVVMMTNGVWYVVFTDPVALVGRSRPMAEHVVVYRNLDAVRSRASDFYKAVGYAPLSADLPALDPAAICLVAPPGEAPHLLVAVLAHWNRTGPVQPALGLRPVVLMPRDGVPPLRFQLTASRPGRVPCGGVGTTEPGARSEAPGEA
jgi:hypothetical protein